MVFRQTLCFLVLLCPVIFSAARGQVPELPPQWFPERAPSVSGQTIRFCIDEREPGHSVDRAIAEAIAQVLLVKPVLVEVNREVIVETDFEKLYVDLVDRCTVYLGFKLYSEAYPNWLIFTRPFYEARFVVLGRTGSPTRLEDVPAGTRIGTVQGTMGDIRFLTYNNSLPASARWLRLPLGNPPLALAALGEGVVDALVIWEPWWWALRQTEVDFAEFQVIEASVVSEPWIRIGGALLADRTTSQLMIDEALIALYSDGTIAHLLETVGFPGRSLEP